ncbi:MAG: alpha/beta hydrolase [Marinosulfonomonas sp.]|nr:alpha/beta hydrolase [Marinosulfonomonas sp.]
MNFSLSGAALSVLLTLGSPLLAASEHNNRVVYQNVDIGPVSVFYREAGPRDAPTILLLHGFPSSSHMFRDLIPELATAYHVIAPDYPGFGQSSTPDAASYDYDFATLAESIEDFTEMLGLADYTLYMQDFGGPVGLRLAQKHPDRVRGIIIQNTTLHVEGWNADVVNQFAPFWENRTAETEKPLRNFLLPETTQWQYSQGASHPERLSPDAWISDQAGLDRPGNDAIQLEYLWNYQDNVANYPAWQSYLAEAQPDTLIVWGKDDPFFTMDGVDALTALLPDAEVHLYDAGHFALETHALEISDAILDFMAK